MHVFAGICWNVLLFATGAEVGGGEMLAANKVKRKLSELLEISLFLLLPLRT